tara:strand:+ start:12662 stop:12862 length:201 start_codon:yes stop_codon:yes gene_type:complete
MPRHLSTVLDAAGLSTQELCAKARIEAAVNPDGFERAAEMVASGLTTDPAEHAALVSLMVEQRDAY